MKSQYVSRLLNERAWKFVIGILLGLSIATNFYSVHAMREFRQDLPPLWLTPDVRFGDYGAEVKLDQVREAYIWHFAGIIFQGINTWETDAEKDFPRMIYAHQAMLTPDYRAFLLKDMALRAKNFELKGRIRYLFPAPGRTFAPEMVEKVDNNKWKVTLDTLVREWSGGGGAPVKNRYVRFSLHVVRWPLSKDFNPFGLALDIPPPLHAVDINEEDLGLAEAKAR